MIISVGLTLETRLIETTVIDALVVFVTVIVFNPALIGLAEVNEIAGVKV